MTFLRTFFRYLSDHHENLFPTAYIITVTALIISLSTSCMTCSILFLIFICSIFIMEALQLLQKYKNSDFDKLLKIWKYAKYLIMSAVAIWAMGNANEFIYLQLRENPNNYPLAVNALISVFTIVNITVIFSWIFFIVAMFFTWSGATVFTRFGRSIALFTFFCIYFLNFNDITNQLGKKIILDAAFVPNLHCSNPILLNQKIAFSSDNKLALAYNVKNQTFTHIECNFIGFMNKHSKKIPQ